MLRDQSPKQKMSEICTDVTTEKTQKLPVSKAEDRCEYGICTESLKYTVTESKSLHNDEQQPSLILSLLLAIQAVETQLLNVIWLPLILANSFCIHPDDPARINVISLSLFSAGFSTLMFNLLGFRFPVLMLPNPGFYTTISILLSKAKQCPGFGDLYAMGPANRTLEWENRFRYIQGGLMTMSLLQALIGFSGISRFIDSLLSNPLVIVPTAITIGFAYGDQILNIAPPPTLSMVTTLTKQTENITGLSLATFFSVIITLVILLTSVFKLKNLKLLTPSFTFSDGFKIKATRIFQLFPVFIANFIALFVYPMIYHLLYGSQGKGIQQTEEILDQAELNSDTFLFHIPYEFGWPDVNVESIVTFLPDTIIHILTSIVIYRTTRYICDKRIPSRKTISNAVLTEGFINLVSSSFGLTSASSAASIGLIKLTEVKRKLVMTLTGLLFILMSIYSPAILKLSKIPIYHLQTIHFILAALITAAGFLMVQKVNVKSNRSFTVIGTSVFAGILLPKIISPYMESSLTLMQMVLFKLTSSNIMVCICTSLLVDSLLPGKHSTSEENDIENTSSEKKNDLSFCEELLAVCI